MAMFIFMVIVFVIWCIKLFYDEESKKTPEDKEIERLRALYRAGKISFIEYDTATAKIQGRGSLIETLGADAALAAGHKVDTDRAVEKLAKDNERGVIIGSAIGSGIGGLGGGIVGGLSAAAQGNAEMNKLLNEQARADARYRDALQKSTRERMSTAYNYNANTYASTPRTSKQEPVNYVQNKAASNAAIFDIDIDDEYEALMEQEHHDM